MTIQIVLILVLIGFCAGVLSGFIGVGGGVIIVPSLVYFLHLTQHQATGTSLFILCMPVVVLGVMNYAQKGNVHWAYGLVIASTFIIGGYFGSKLSLRLPQGWVKFIFGLIMAYVAFVMIRSGYTAIKNNN